MKVLLSKNLEKLNLPIIAIKDIVIFPNSAHPIYVNKNAAIQSIDEAMGKKRNIILAYYNSEDTRLTLENLNKYATLSRIVQVKKLSDNSSRILLEGIEKIRLLRIEEKKEGFKAVGEYVQLDNELTSENLTRMKALQDNFKKLAKKNLKIPREIIQAIDKSDTPHNLMDQILSHISIPYKKKLVFFNTTNTLKRLDDLALELESEKELFVLKDDINQRVKKRIDETHREYIINEQIKELNKELGKDDPDSNGVKELETRLQEANLPQIVREQANHELSRLRHQQSLSAEASIIRSYIEWILNIPWNIHTETEVSIAEASTILNEDHYKMEEPKDRILDFIAVLKIRRNLKGPILCFVGPPGTGKTSLGASLARAMGKKFVRISLGGLRDEAEIRGHRRTYVAALPGKIVQGLKRAGSSNPVFLLDEIDKLGNDHRGDPSSALLEVLDPEQNKQFVDHYMEVPIDLSQVLFITTANSVQNIPYPLLNRMEIIQIPGYSGLEKINIAMDFIIPKQLKEHGLESANIKFSKTIIHTIIENYTRESGVRNLEREVAKVIRKVARISLENGKINIDTIPNENLEKADLLENADSLKNADLLENAESEDSDSQELRNKPLQPKTTFDSFAYQVSQKDLHKFLGPKKYENDILFKEQKPGLIYGMAWTELGGKLLPIEAIILKTMGKGKLKLTGSLGDVMKESAQIGLSLTRQFIEQNKLIENLEFIQRADIHIHIPEGAIPKDGPSAGITLTLSLLSLFINQCIPSFTAMTGEITLTGRILPVGGITEKILAAHRNHFKNILIPVENKKDYEKLPQEVKKSMVFTFVENIQQAISHLFGIGSS